LASFQFVARRVLIEEESKEGKQDIDDSGERAALSSLRLSQEIARRKIALPPSPLASDVASRALATSLLQ
jgi:hypothetical protein